MLAIDNEWGSGKTTFIKMWEAYLKPDFQTIYFNSWENDFESDPMVAIMSQLKPLMTSKNKHVFYKALEHGATLVKNLAPVIAQAIAEKYIDTASLKEGIESIAKASTEILEEEIEEFTKRKGSITKFRINLAEFISARENKNR